MPDCSLTTDWLINKTDEVWAGAARQQGKKHVEVGGEVGEEKGEVAGDRWRACGAPANYVD